jgi:hypothetical protein
MSDDLWFEARAGEVAPVESGDVEPWRYGSDVEDLGLVPAEAPALDEGVPA